MHCEHGAVDALLCPTCRELDWAIDTIMRPGAPPAPPSALRQTLTRGSATLLLQLAEDTDAHRTERGLTDLALKGAIRELKEILHGQ